ncbi:sensor histidine kinase [Nonomuraea sp. NPDC002799]
MNPIERARRLTWKLLVSIVVMMWVCVLASGAMAYGDGRPQWWRFGLALIVTAAFTERCLRMINALLDRRYPTGNVVMTAVLAVLAAALGGAEPVGFGFVLMCWLSLATLEVPKRTAHLLAAGTFVVAMALCGLPVVTGNTLLATDLADTEALVLYAVAYAAWCALLPQGNRMLMWIWVLAVEAHEGREAHTRLAVAEERLRFARDLHDLVGHQLSAIAVKTQLAIRLSDAGATAAKAEMTEVNTLTRQALKDLREAVRGYRELDLPTELNSVKGVLEAAGVRCDVHLPYRDLPDGVAPVFAYAAREAVTNVLKHSTATFCDITIRFTDREAELSVRNDGAARRKAGDPGNGLAVMGERLAAVGGRVAAHRTDDGEFLLKAVVSLPIGG